MERRYVIVKPDFLLRGWQGVPHALVRRDGSGKPFVFAKGVFNTLQFCNGRFTADSPIFLGQRKEHLSAFDKHGLLDYLDEPGSLDPEQEYRLYPNRYLERVHWSLTGHCNYRCRHCYMSAPHAALPQPTLGRCLEIADQIADCGVMHVSLTGGEPLVRKKDLLTLVSENRDCIFLAFTNGTLVDDEFCEDMKKAGNLALALSVEGTEETTDARRGDGVYAQVIKAMQTLKKHKCIFGTSVCYTSQNYEAVTSDEFYDMEIENGAIFSWYFHYMPVGSDADTSLLLTPEQREHVYRTIRAKRDSKNGKPIFTVDFQNDGEFVGGCIAGGRNYFHVNSEGDVEPCVFIHYSDSNIREKSVLECLRSPLFKEYYKGQPFNDNMLRPCPMLENPEALVNIVNKTGAKSTNLTCPESAEALCAKCEHYAAHWAPKAKEIWEEKERFHPFTQYYRDTEEGKAELNK